jgi:dolichol kinase
MTTTAIGVRPLNWHRSGFHALSGIVMAVVFGTASPSRVLRTVVAGIAVSAWLMEAARQVSPAVNRLLMTVFRKVAHPHEGTKVNSATWYATALCLLSNVAGGREIAVALVILAVADPVAGFVGRRYGKVRLLANRTLEGTTAFVVSGLLVGWALQLLLFQGDWWQAGLVALTAAVFSALAELFSVRLLDDNLTIPLAAALAVRCAEALVPISHGLVLYGKAWPLCTIAT